VSLWSHLIVYVRHFRAHDSICSYYCIAGLINTVFVCLQVFYVAVLMASSWKLFEGIMSECVRLLGKRGNL
jgi:hypothetical protein